MSAFVSFLSDLGRVHSIEAGVFATTLGPSRSEYLRRRWIREDGYLTHVLVPFLDSQEEVEIDIDEDARVFRYRSPHQRIRTIVRPLADITRHAWQTDVWLDDLAALMGIESRRLPDRRVLVPGRLWHLGDIRIAGTHDFGPVFIGRLPDGAPGSEITAALCDPIWPRGGVLLRARPAANALPGDHVVRGLGEFVRVKNDCDIFDASAFDRVLRGFVTPGGEQEPAQFLQGARLKLPHFLKSRELSPERARIIKIMWGTDGTPPPVMSWQEVNAQANTGYQSLDDAFDTKEARDGLIEKISWGRYRLRRNP